MNNVVSISRKKFLGSFMETQNRRPDFEERFLFSGTLMSLVLPPIICLFYAEFVPFLMFAGIILLGGIAGVTIFASRNSEKVLNIKVNEVMPQAPTGKIINIKKAA